VVLLGCASGPVHTYPGPPRPPEEVALLSDSAGASVWAIDGSEVSGSKWALLPGEHELYVKINIYPRVASVNFRIRYYCRVLLEATAGAQYVAFIRTWIEMDPTETLKMERGVAQVGGPETLAVACSADRPDL